MFTLAFFRATGERAVRAFASTLVSTWVVAGGVLDIRGVDWGSSLGVAGGAAVISILLSLVAGKGVGPVGSPSFVPDPAAAGKPALAPADERKTGGYVGGHRPGPPAG